MDIEIFINSTSVPSVNLLSSKLVEEPNIDMADTFVPISSVGIIDNASTVNDFLNNVNEDTIAVIEGPLAVSDYSQVSAKLFDAINITVHDYISANAQSSHISDIIDTSETIMAPTYNTPNSAIAQNTLVTPYHYREASKSDSNVDISVIPLSPTSSCPVTDIDQDPLDSNSSLPMDTTTNNDSEKGCISVCATTSDDSIHVTVCTAELKDNPDTSDT